MLEKLFFNEFGLQATSVGFGRSGSQFDFGTEELRLGAQDMNIEHHFDSGQIFSGNRSFATNIGNILAVEPHRGHSVLLGEVNRALVMEGLRDDNDICLSKNLFGTHD